MIAVADLLGVGLYSPVEAALYARVSTRLMTRWTYGSGEDQSVIDPQLHDTEDKTLTFLDFVQTLAIGRLRTDVRISLQKIRRAYDYAREHFKVEYPFALKTTRFGLFGPPNDSKRQELYVCIGEDEAGASRYFQITGEKRGNQLIREVVRTYARHIVFDERDLAARYYPFPLAGQQIVMDPAVRFGEPYLESCGYTARTLYDAYQAERTVDRVAAMYGVTTQEIELAIDYFDYLLVPKAA